MRGFSLSLFLALVVLVVLPLTYPTRPAHGPSVFVLGVAPFAALGLILGLIELTEARARKRGWGKPIAAIVICCFSFAFWAATWPGKNYGSTESSVLGDIRTVISAEAAYESVNGGAFDTLDCLAAPRVCLPGYPQTAPTFVDSMLASLQPARGYERHFVAGPHSGKGRSRSSLTSYAYIAVPIKPGETGARGFCGDSSGAICVTMDGRMPPVRNGRCWTIDDDPVAGCPFLR